MSEEAFRAVRITLSEEAFDRLDKIMKDAAFRNYSSTIEECIRATSDLIEEIHTMSGKKDAPNVDLSDEECANSFMRILFRMYRFTGRRPLPRRK